MVSFFKYLSCIKYTTKGVIFKNAKESITDIIKRLSCVNTPNTFNTITSKDKIDIATKHIILNLLAFLSDNLLIKSLFIISHPYFFIIL